MIPDGNPVAVITPSDNLFDHLIYQRALHKHGIDRGRRLVEGSDHLLFPLGIQPRLVHGIPSEAESDGGNGRNIPANEISRKLESGPDGSGNCIT